MIGTTISHYKILEELGCGGMGVIYKAEDIKLKRIVALKFLPPELTSDPIAKERFIREAQAASALQHNNICTIHDVDETSNGKLFIVMDCYEGQILKNKIKDQRLKVNEAIDIAIQIGKGLDKAHEKGIVHRDIKPANILITKDGIVKILDFGLAKLAGQAQLTKDGSTLGTVAYMSPEQVKGESIDHRTDLWSLGVVFYEMLTGYLPFRGEFDQAVMYAAVNEEPQSVSDLREDIPAELEQIIMNLLAKDPNQRYAQMNELLKDLNRLKIEADSLITHEGNRRFLSNKIISRFLPLFVVLCVSFIAVWLYFNPQKESGEISNRIKLAVLPFENLSTVDHDYFAAGVCEEITSRLATVNRLGVISRKSAIHYAETDKTIRQIGEELDVEYILEGTVRWAVTPEGTDRVRITPQLIRVKDDTHIWAQSYDRIITDIFQIQSEIAQRVIEQIGITILDSERSSVSYHLTDNMDAYHAYLQGQYYAARPHFTSSNWKSAIEYYQQAVELDSNFALAYAKLAKGHSRLYYLRADLSEERVILARRAAQKALELAPRSAYVHLDLSYYFLWTYLDFEQALAELKIAEKGLPNNVDLLKAKINILHPKGHWDECIRLTKQAFELSPRDVSLTTDLAEFYWVTRQYKNAISACEKAIAMDPEANWPYLFKAFTLWCRKGATDEADRALQNVSPEHEWYYWSWYWQHMGRRDIQGAIDRLSTVPNNWISNKCWALPKSLLLAFIYDYSSKEDRARSAYDRARLLLETKIAEEPDDPRYHSSLGLAYAGLGLKEDAIAQGKKAVDLLPLSQDAFYGIPYIQDLAIIYIMTGDFEKALEQTELLFSMPSWISPSFLQLDFRFEPLYELPEYQKLLKKYFG